MWRYSMKKKLFLPTLVLLMVGAILCAGCGETVRGMGKDAHRIGRGTKTIFVADE